MMMVASLWLPPDVLQGYGCEVRGDLDCVLLVAEDGEEGAFHLAVAVEDTRV